MIRKRIAERLVQMIVVLIGITFLTFLLTYIAPGDPVEAMYSAMGVTPSPEVMEQTRITMGLDKPFLEQYCSWVSKAVTGDLGDSYSKRQPVINMLSSRVMPTLRLALFSLALMLIVSFPLGILSAVRKDGIADLIIRFLTFIGIAMPGFWLGLLLLYFIALKLNLLPVASTGTGLKSMLLPAITLAISMSSKYTRHVRTAVLEELNQDYIAGAKARGVGSFRILWAHVLPNAMLPLVTLIGLSFGSLLGGSSIVEIIFAYPGLGNLAVSAVNARDYPLIQGFVLYIALIYMVMNLIVDISYNFIDPRMREK